MILAREQINRYLRHIIMPEISGPGQKKLLETTVFVCGENIAAAAPAIFYLAAAGIGKVQCQFENADGFDSLAASIRDLNSDVAITLAGRNTGQLRIFLGRPGFLVRQNDQIAEEFIPSVIALQNGWKGGLAVLKSLTAAEKFLSELSAAQQPTDSDSQEYPGKSGVFSCCFSGALCAMEVVKLALAIGETTANFLSFNLLTMDFAKACENDISRILAEVCAIKPEECREFSLDQSKVLIVGTGGLGSPAAYALAAAGIGTIGLVDYDTVEISNLNRQILHAGSRIGMPKVESAAVFLKNLNPQLVVKMYNTSLTKENVFDILDGFDVVIVAVDNFPARFLLNDACFLAGKPMIDAGVIRFNGTSMTITTPQGPCYRCTLPNIPSSGTTPSCSETGVLGPLPGVMGFIQSAEAAKLLSGQGELLSGRMVYFDGLVSRFGTLRLNKAPDCALCGTNPAIRELQEYGFVCTGTAEAES